MGKQRDDRAFMELKGQLAGQLYAAAEQLNYTPSGVSQLVTAFENELGFALRRLREAYLLQRAEN